MDARNAGILYVKNVTQFHPKTNIIWKYAWTCMEQKSESACSNAVASRNASKIAIINLPKIMKIALVR